MRHAASSPTRQSARRSRCTFDRPALIDQLFKGRAELGNDHVIWQGYPYFDSAIPQRTQDIDKAKALLSDGRASPT